MIRNKGREPSRMMLRFANHVPAIHKKRRHMHLLKLWYTMALLYFELIGKRSTDLSAS